MDPNTLSSIILKFSVRLLNELDKNGSVVSSPLSSEYLLALLTLGAIDPAHNELLTALGFPDDDSIRLAFASLKSNLTNIKGVLLKVANKIYVKEDNYDFQQSIIEDAVNVFDADIEKVNFRERAKAAIIINQWVESKTNEKIKDLIDPDFLDKDTSLILVNAIYFKGSWKLKFDKNNTSAATFHTNVNETIEVPTMFKTNMYRYGNSEFLEAELLEIPYEGDEATMLIILPNEIDGVDEVLKKLTGDHDLMTEVENSKVQKVHVHLPKFKIETKIMLNEVLKKLGIKAIFNGKVCCFSKLLNNKEHPYVSEAIQKTIIEVNEEGAEAAAVTGMKRVLKRKEPFLPVFRANRPFLYLLFGPQRITYFIGVYRGDNKN